MVNSIATLLLSALAFSVAGAQDYTTSSIFAHNDYAQPIPFLAAYSEQVGYIEADIFLKQNDLLVAHTEQEIKNETLEELYIKPLLKKITNNGGFVYANQEKRLTLMIDLKTEGVPTLNMLVRKLKKYPPITSCPTLQITVSGNVPDPATWKNYPAFIHFDGRPGIPYTNEQLARVSLISTNFSNHAQWNGKGVLTTEELGKLRQVIDAIHVKGKKVRFWGAPDFNNAWMVLMNLKVDIINTDHVNELATYLKNYTKNSYQHVSPQAVYTPAYHSDLSKSAPKNIVLMIGDGMGLAQLYSGYTANRGRLNIFSMNDIGFSVTTSADSYITDSAAGATAMASGRKTNNRFVGVDSAGRTLTSITEKLKQKGFRTAIISSGDITDATPAAFYAHQPERNLSEAIAADFLAGKNDILIGAGAYAFTNRTDKNNLLFDLRRKGYSVSETFSSIDTIKNTKYVILDNAAGKSTKQGRTDFLAKSLQKSISSLTMDDAPFFIMAEGAQIDDGGHDNDMEFMVQELLDFDQAVGEVMKFIDRNKETLLIVTADHETGGLTLLGGNISKGYVNGNFSTNDHTAVMVPVFSYGPGAEMFRGVYQNTEISSKIQKLLSVE